MWEGGVEAGITSGLVSTDMWAPIKNILLYKINNKNEWKHMLRGSYMTDKV